jgi:hypothetical protein
MKIHSSGQTRDWYATILMTAILKCHSNSRNYSDPKAENRIGVKSPFSCNLNTTFKENNKFCFFSLFTDLTFG